MSILSYAGSEGIKMLVQKHHQYLPNETTVDIPYQQITDCPPASHTHRPASHKTRPPQDSNGNSPRARSRTLPHTAPTWLCRSRPGLDHAHHVQICPIHHGVWTTGIPAPPMARITAFIALCLGMMEILNAITASSCLRHRRSSFPQGRPRGTIRHTPIKHPTLKHPSRVLVHVHPTTVVDTL
ncbi:hypothetical protein BS17DRAFT_322718 [Gyrodon lividus]|nr:hypothetical protein BS17DRAFT_322718 [Gyrodon lividus]